MSAGELPVRIGIVRADRPPPLLAEIDARVISHELSRRLGPVSCDLRVVGDPIGQWSSRSTAAWPADVDAIIDLADHLAADQHLSAMFGRTVDAHAAEIRARMLAHLAIEGPLTDDVLDATTPWRPTDVWIIAREHGVDAGADPALVALADGGEDRQPALDAMFDQITSQLAEGAGANRHETTESHQVARLLATTSDLEDRLERQADEARRDAADAAARIDELTAELSVVRERQQRTDLDPPTDR
jgi:hypothetical protein